MNIYSPRRVFLQAFNVFDNYYSSFEDIISGLETGIPIYMDGVYDTVKSSTFKETKHRRLNDVVHAKLTSNIGLKPICENLSLSGSVGLSTPYALSSGVHLLKDDIDTTVYVAFVSHPSHTVFYGITFQRDGIHSDVVVDFHAEYRQIVGRGTNPITLRYMTGEILRFPTVVDGKFSYSLPEDSFYPENNILRNLLFGACAEYASSIPVVLLPREDEVKLNIFEKLIGIVESQDDSASYFDPNASHPQSRELYQSGFPEVAAERIPLPEISLNSFMLDEPSRIFSTFSPFTSLTGHTFQGYYTNIGIQRAMIDACNDVPILNNNSLSNIGELVSFIQNLVLHRKIEIPHSLSDAWLAYRYEYGTSSMDARDAISFVHRHMPSGTNCSIKSYGSDSLVINGVRTTVRCCLELRDKNMDILDKVWSALYKYGLQPNFYVLWDMIPYSFVVDWFIPIGDALSASDAMHHITETYDVISKDFSISYNDKIATSGYGYHCYSRWQNNSERFDPLYWFESNPTSDKTHLFRFFDGVSLILGRH